MRIPLQFCGKRRKIEKHIAQDVYQIEHHRRNPTNSRHKQNYNATFYQFSPHNNFVHDERGFSHFLLGEASTFLKSTTSPITGRISITDPRVLLSRNVTKIDYSLSSSSAKESGPVKVTMENGECVEAEHVLVTFSLGVLQAGVVEFVPALPDVSFFNLLVWYFVYVHMCVEYADVGNLVGSGKQKR